MRPKRSDSKSGCSVEVTLSVIGGLWKPVILFHLLKEKKRFMELTRLMPNTTQRMLTLQLRELEADGIVARHVYPQVPPKVEYELTPFGTTLAPVLISLREWGDAYRTHQSGAGSAESARDAATCDAPTQSRKRTAGAMKAV
ncbi:winged helix-turn-helix transcriptional regulator [Burkholderia thailandensis]|uniref:Transcriptional regulator family protein n=1 Tax=Burkholderia thailandensis (strain ATCC 700388 / DSM 13276 / CCUG 48851 / CIP 106301 / E264) TaxID=271848 RepID=Q2SYL6_BURTA|nr:helix-turn-helix domain-containing protein [Burkholderia thailandensis]ABC36683.1 transcriptional regulator family protein [Burkholderia thailandensis E264]AHI73377.1 hxlR-like helix-turn-helix family protein [Burkholderia thailandensis 2002721723]AHI78244.1 hxlR-like helix-turn-helix family protein [Burkholderia thailandensis E444]AIC86061.1 hxlR-like helix-turn-helix family protein [Burkholderia thailandensis USAMRU Malaysia \